MIIVFPILSSVTKSVVIYAHYRDRCVGFNIRVLGTEGSISEVFILVISEINKHVVLFPYFLKTSI